MLRFLLIYRYDIIYCIMLIIAILLLYTGYKDRKERKSDLKKENEELKKLLYPNRNYKCKGIEYYSETPRERLMRIFDEMDPAGQDKLCDYAERLERDRENSRYYQQK